MENTILTPASPHNTDIISEISTFKRLTERTAALINENGCNIQPYSEEALEKLSTLSLINVRTCNSKLMHNLQLIESSASASKTSNKALVKSILSLMKLCVNDDFIDQITEEDIVEIYSPEGVQVFRNLKFYETTAYTLADLLIFEWNELYLRPTKVYEKLAEYVDYCINKAKSNEIINLKHLASHIIKEIKSRPVSLLEVKFGNMAPVTTFGGANAGLICTCRAKNMLSLSDESIFFI